MLNLKQVAQHLGVHYMTAYRYVRQGRLAAEWEGSGWRVRTEDLEAFVARSEGSSIARAQPGPGRDRVDWAGRLADRFLAGDEPGAWSVAERALVAGVTPQSCYLDLVAGALVRISEANGAGALGMADSYVATATATRVVARLGTRFRRPGRSRGMVVLGAPRGEMHSLPIAIVADLVRLAGFAVLELGADVPPEAFVAAANRVDRLVAVGVGVTRVEALDGAAAVVAALRAARPEVPVLIGGQAVRNPEMAQLAGATGWAGGGAELVAAVEALAPGQCPSVT